MKPANMWPWGIVSDDVDNRRLTVADTVVSCGVSAGVHSRTNIYIDPSNNDWIIPKHNIFGSENRENIIMTLSVQPSLLNNGYFKVLNLILWIIIGEWVMLSNATFNNISAISWQSLSVLLVEETGVPRENHRPAASHFIT